MLLSTTPRKLCVQLLLATTAAHAGWVEIDATYKDETTFIEPTRVRRDGVKAFYWTMTNYAKPRSLSPDKPALSNLTQSVVDCERQANAVLYIVWYAGPNATGETINTLTVPSTSLDFHPLVPNSIGEKEARVACSSH